MVASILLTLVAITTFLVIEAYFEMGRELPSRQTRRKAVHRVMPHSNRKAS